MLDLLPPVSELLHLLTDDAAALFSTITYLLEQCKQDPFIVARQCMTFVHMLVTGVSCTCRQEEVILSVNNKESFSKLLLHFSCATRWGDVVLLGNSILNPLIHETTEAKASGLDVSCYMQTTHPAAHLACRVAWIVCTSPAPC